MVYSWCSANLKWWRMGQEVRAMRNSFFYNMVCCSIGYLSAVPYLSRETFALTAIVFLENEGVVGKRYRPFR